MEKNNCVVCREFNVSGGTYYLGRELCLGAVLLEDWVRRGFVKLLVADVVDAEYVPDKPKKQPRKNRTVKTNTAIKI